MHVMDAFVSHGVLIVDVTNGGTDFTHAIQLSNMWNATQAFFERTIPGGEGEGKPPASSGKNDNNAAAITAPSSSLEESLPPLQTIPEAGSTHAKIGYVSYDYGSLRFLETRTEYQSQTLLPKLDPSILTTGNVHALQTAFQIMAQMGKAVIRIATAASSIANGAFFMSGSPSTTTGGGKVPDLRNKRKNLSRSEAEAEASRCALLLANEMIDDGQSLPSTSTLEIDRERLGSVSMSPHRLCQYSDQRPEPSSNDNDNEDNANKKNTKDSISTTKKPSSAREIFGAHTDSSFVTIVPVAAVSGLEVFDEAAELWYRPELRARRHWEQGQLASGKDPTALTESVAWTVVSSSADVNESMTTTTSTKEGEEAGVVTLPWHARYIAILPGEHLQLATRDEVPAAVHRVVAAKKESRTTNGTGSSTTSSSSPQPPPRRWSAPVLLRGRPGITFDTNRYLGGSLGNPLLEECHGKTMEEIHSATQPSS
jgi:hypothetical protein